MVSIATHNKENTSFSLTDVDAITLSLRSSLSGVSVRPKKHHLQGTIGIGRAPKHSSYPRRYVSSTKPYARGRNTSVTRAKLASASSSSTSSSGKVQRRVKAKPKERPPPLKLDDAAYDLKVMQERVKKARYDPANGDVGQVRMPLKLPFPQIPPIEHVDQEGLRDVPVDYILNKLLPLLPSISTITLAYKPYPQIPHPSPFPSSSSSTRTLALAIPEIMDGRKPEWQAKTRGREPNMCLAIRQRAGEATAGDMVIAVNSLVFASQCSYWNRLISASRLPSSSSSTTPSTSASKQATPSETASESEDGSDADEYESLEPSPLPPVIKDPHGFLHLPILPILLPSPPTFHLIHRLLHHPSLPCLPSFLGLPDHASRQDMLRQLGEMDVQELMGKAGVLQGVWKNLCALGVARASVWRQLGEAWSFVTGIIAGHGLLIVGQVRSEGGGAKSGAEEVAWEWVGMMRERERVKKEEWARGAAAGGQ
ncbi:hypothetical protein L202_08052 [Cryptococcus amylolentus CBS 6039]|uniref:Clampless protein 1 n=1 Tax=Cryptococcus amylolentus CBS 6039 TaxID=1295533 RepID=A0A1E3HB61_9TREE|nr:hypothetical protein L202_08052 [Cryptococcus amylolentus CBS 6039]ODN73554.1 hypothetical protein L202_08052 [Cryptococcus amylolentus CBS 6039]